MHFEEISKEEVKEQYQFLKELFDDLNELEHTILHTVVSDGQLATKENNYLGIGEKYKALRAAKDMVCSDRVILEVASAYTCLATIMVYFSEKMSEVENALAMILQEGIEEAESSKKHMDKKEEPITKLRKRNLSTVH